MASVRPPRPPLRSRYVQGVVGAGTRARSRMLKASIWGQKMGVPPVSKAGFSKYLNERTQRYHTLLRRHAPRARLLLGVQKFGHRIGWKGGALLGIGALGAGKFLYNRRRRGQD